MGNTNAKLLLLLHKAVIEDDAEKVRELLKVEDLDMNHRGEEELTALQLAIVNGSLKSLQVMLECDNMDLESLTPEKQTPLILAAAKGQEDIALGFLEAFSEDLLHLDSVDVHQLQALHYASSQGQEKLVEELLRRGMDVDAVGGKLKHTPLMLAAQNGHDSVVKLLLEAGAHKSCLDLARMTALHHACSQPHGNEACVRLLLGEEKPHHGGEEGAAPQDWVNARDISGCTPLLYCLNNKNRVLEKLLVARGANLTEALDGGFEYCYHTLQSSN